MIESFYLFPFQTAFFLQKRAVFDVAGLKKGMKKKPGFQDKVLLAKPKKSLDPSIAKCITDANPGRQNTIWTSQAAG